MIQAAQRKLQLDPPKGKELETLPKYSSADMLGLAPALVPDRRWPCLLLLEVFSGVEDERGYQALVHGVAGARLLAALAHAGGAMRIRSSRWRAAPPWPSPTASAARGADRLGGRWRCRRSRAGAFLAPREAERGEFYALTCSPPAA